MMKSSPIEPLKPNLTAGLHIGKITAVILGALSVAACSPSASDALQQGKSFVAKGELPAAVISFKNAVQAEPGSLPARLALADALESSDDLVSAEQQYRRALDLGGNADEIVPKIAVLLLDRGEMAVLVRDFESKQLSSPTADSDLRGALTQAHLALGQQDAATAQIGRAASKTASVRLAQAQIDLAAKRRPEALAELDAALRDAPVPWWVWRAASRVYNANGDKAKALATLQHAFELAPRHHGVIGEYAELLVNNGRSADARPLRDKLKSTAPHYYRTLYVDALFLMSEGKFDEAWSAATQVLALVPEHQQARIIAATVELNRGELTSADARVAKILAKDPYSLAGLRMRAFIDLRRGNIKDAAAALEQALRLAPNDTSLLAVAADLAWARGDKTGAVKQLEQANHVPPPQPEMLARLGEMQLALDRRSEGISAIDKAIELSKNDARHRDEVFRSLFRMHLPDKAKTMAQSELEQRPKDPEPYLWMAAVLGSEGNDAAALEQTGRALDLQPDYYPALVALAMTAKTPERVAEYGSRLQKAVDSGSKDARIYLDRARVLRSTGAGPEQIGAVLERGVAAEATSVKLREAAVQHWLSLGRTDKALALAKAGEDALPDNATMIALAASTHDAAGEPQQAMQRYAQLSARFPDRLDWNLAYAQILARSGKIPEAITLLRKLINLRPDEPMPYQMLAALQTDQSQIADALITAGMLRDRPQLRAAGWLLLGDVHSRANHKSDALSAYAEAGKAGATEAALLRKVELLDKTGGQSIASAALHDWLTAHADSIPALSLASRRETARLDFAASARYLETITKLDPKNFVAFNELAWAYAKAHNPASLAAARKAADLAPENPTVLDTLAEAQNQAGNKTEAMATLRHALSLAPRTAIVRIHLAELLVADAKKKEAAELLVDLQERTLDQDGAQRFKAVKASL